LGQEEKKYLNKGTAIPRVKTRPNDVGRRPAAAETFRSGGGKKSLDKEKGHREPPENEVHVKHKPEKEKNRHHMTEKT